MALTNTGLVDDNFKVIKVITGKKSEDETIIDVEKLSGATNESKISVANVYHEVVNEKVNNVEQTGQVTLQFDDGDPFLTLTGRDNYGLKPSEAKIKPESGAGNIKVKTGTNLKNFSLIIECHKESGFTTV
tara:strand:- start:2989 stop:3381 length:393 start_codon:yes stop_codon:yes gene_type:complete